ncbi:hypothetical protein [Mucilaginibacter sp. NFX135]|uniref:hypothetical protein n=1 Tax=Mucilaginibacter sp. NFX135 TaxID=3402687 RepID=UPI003AFB1B98
MIQELGLTELSYDEALEISGGVSTRTVIIGGVLTVISPVLGAAFWIGYAVESVKG